MWALSDEALLAGLAAGDHDAAAAFIRRFQHRVFGLTRTILVDPRAAEDAAQETFLRAWRHAGAYDARRGAVATWLLTIARNVAVDMVRMRRPEPIDPRVAVATIESAAEASQEHTDPYEIADQTGRLMAALRALPEEQKRALVLAAFFGYTTREISSLEDAPQGTIKTRIRTALGKLRASMGVRNE